MVVNDIQSFAVRACLFENGNKTKQILKPVLFWLSNPSNTASISKDQKTTKTRVGLALVGFHANGGSASEK